MHAMNVPLDKPAEMRPLRLEFDPQLPISAHRAEITNALLRHPVIVVCGATGSGKTTQIPKLCLEAGRGVQGLIGHTQPRRIAARAIAARLAGELGTEVGGVVGCQVRFSDRTGPDCRIKLMTDGILLRELERDPALRRYDTLIIDEAHERTLNIDLLLGVLKRAVALRPELRLIVTSATIDPARFASFFDGAPVIEVSGRSFPVEVRYRPLLVPDAEAAEPSLVDGVVAAVDELAAAEPLGRGDVLVFLPGEKHIREAAHALERAESARKGASAEILPLYARLSATDQERIFEPHRRPRVILATNVAETSLTVPGIRHVVDSGLARIGRYNPRGKVQRLPIEPISRASAEQRRGRCGREAPGICIRLYSQEDHEGREAFTAPEVLRTNLASVILQMAARGLGQPADFPFLDPPDSRLVNDGVRLLQELGAMDGERRITRLGRQIAALPVDPRLARMLLAAAGHGCLDDMIVIAAFLETQDPRERPAGAERQAQECHAAFADPRSDFLSALKLWRAFRAQSAALGARARRAWCRERFLSFVRLREWQSLHDQLTAAVRDLGLKPGRQAPSYAGLHRAILSGLLGSIGRLVEKRDYAGARGISFTIAPGTPLAARPPRWIVAGSLVETTRLYARVVALVQPAWIEAAGAHLVKRSYGEAHWRPARGCVAAEETVSLYGLNLASGRLVNFAPIDPAAAREIFAREALVEGRGGLQAPFLEANRALRAQLERLEAKLRRRDILVDEAAQVEFYLARIPPRIDTLSAFERWRAEVERGAPRFLFMSTADLARRDAPEASEADFPDYLLVGENRLPLEYRFEPGTSDDGVTLLVPESLLGALDPERLAWLVPGMQLEKLIAVLRLLPKALRKRFVPVPEHAARALADARRANPERLPPFHAWLARWITREAGAPFEPRELAALPIADALRVQLRVIDAKARPVAAGRDLELLRRRRRSLQPAPTPPPEPGDSLHRQWDFGPLPASTRIERGHLMLVEYPTLEDRGTGVALLTAGSPLTAAAMLRTGLTRLAVLALPPAARRIRARAAQDHELLLLAHGLPLERPIADTLVDRAFREALFPETEELPRSAGEFSARLATHAPGIEARAEAEIEQLRHILTAARSTRRALEALGSAVFAAARADLAGQLATLFAPRFLDETPAAWLAQYPRYLKAIERRIERLRDDILRDAGLMQRVRPFDAACRALEQSAPARATGPDIERLRWMIEEYRVSLYAQELGTVLRVSEPRLAAQLEAARRS
jgi:ATP-dependent helicase HrpA